MKSFARLSFVVFLMVLLVFPCNKTFASDFKMTIDCQPQSIDINDFSLVTITLHDDNGKAVSGQNIFVGVTGIKGNFSTEMLITNNEGTATTKFYPSELGMGYIISKANIRQGTTIVSITAETTIRVDNLNKAPIATITSATPNPVIIGKTIQFTGTGEDSDGEVTDWKWDMGDGTIFTGIDYSSSVTHIYEKSGEYKVTFLVRDDADVWSNPSWITVKAFINNEPVVTPVGSWESSVVANQEITIEVMISDSDSNLSNCIFDWGDGSTEEFLINGSNAKLKASHVYENTGIFLIKVIAADKNEGITQYPKDGWKLKVYGESKGGVKILFPGFAGESVDFIGPFPSRNIALTKILEDWGIDAGFSLVPGNYQLLFSNRTSAIKPISGDLTIRPFKTSEVKCVRWSPKIATNIYIIENKPPIIVGKFYDNDGDIDKPALLNISHSNNKNGRNLTTNSGQFIIPITNNDIGSVDIDYRIDGVVGSERVIIPETLPKIKIIAKPLVDDSIQLDILGDSTIEKVKLNTTTFSMVTGRRISTESVVSGIPSECEPGITKLKINRFDSYKFIVKVEATYTNGNVISKDSTSFVPYIGSQKLSFSWGYSDDNILFYGFLTNKDSGEILKNQRFHISTMDKVVQTLSPKNGLFFQSINVSDILKRNELEILELEISTTSAGLNYSEKIIIRHFDRYPKLDIKKENNKLEFQLIDENDDPIPGSWISAAFMSDGELITDDLKLKALGYPESSIRTSISGTANLGFQDSDFDNLSVLIKANINGYPILKHFKIK